MHGLVICRAFSAFLLVAKYMGLRHASEQVHRRRLHPMLVYVAPSALTLGNSGFDQGVCRTEGAKAVFPNENGLL